MTSQCLSDADPHKILTQISQSPDEGKMQKKGCFNYAFMTTFLKDFFITLAGLFNFDMIPPLSDYFSPNFLI